LKPNWSRIFVQDPAPWASTPWRSRSSSESDHFRGFLRFFGGGAAGWSSSGSTSSGASTSTSSGASQDRRAASQWLCRQYQRSGRSDVSTAAGILRHVHPLQ
jgi:hypothetical protein